MDGLPPGDEYQLSPDRSLDCQWRGVLMATTPFLEAFRQISSATNLIDSGEGNL